MAKRRPKRRIRTDEYTFLAIEVQGFDARSTASLNPYLREDGPVYARPEDRVFEFETKLEIRVCAAIRRSQLGTLMICISVAASFM